MQSGTHKEMGKVLAQAESIEDVRELERMLKERLEKLIRSERSEWTIRKTWLARQASNCWTSEKGSTKYLEKHGEGAYSMNPTKVDDCRVRWFPCKLYADEFIANMRADQPESFQSRFAVVELISRRKRKKQ